MTEIQLPHPNHDVFYAPHLWTSVKWSTLVCFIVLVVENGAGMPKGNGEKSSCPLRPGDVVQGRTERSSWWRPCPSWRIQPQKYLQGGLMICTNIQSLPTYNNIPFYCDLNKELPSASSSVWTKWTDQLWAQLTNIFIEKALSTESCPGCLECFALDRYLAQITRKEYWISQKVEGPQDTQDPAPEATTRIKDHHGQSGLTCDLV